MCTLEPIAEPVSSSPTGVTESLFQLQLRVARRADQLAGGGTSSRARDLWAWFQAERELLGEPAMVRGDSLALAGVV